MPKETQRKPFIMNYSRFKQAIYPILYSVFASSAIYADDFPEMTQFSEDGQILFSQGIDDSGFYDISVVRNVYLEFEDTDYWTQLQNNYNTDNYVLADLTVEGETYVDVAVQFKGNTSYNRLGSSQKTSFDIKLDYVNEDQDIDGYETLNLNNCFEDDTMMREVIYCNQAKQHTPIAKANFVNLYINGENWGVYANVQQLNKDFLDEWFTNKNGPRWRALSTEDKESGFQTVGGRPVGGGGPGGGWGNGESALNYLGDSGTDYEPYYTLKTDFDDTEVEAACWDLLANACDILNNTPDEQLYEELNQVLNVDATLWFLATELIFADDDSYVHKGTMDYYIYINPETGRLTPLEYDGNSVLSSSNSRWSIFMNADDENYPLLNRLLNLPETRQRYLAHVRTLLSSVFDPEVISEQIDNYHLLIDELVSADPKKLMSYNEYISGISSLKSIVQTRYDYLASDSEISTTSAIKPDSVSFFTNGTMDQTPNSDESVLISVSIPSDQLSNIATVNLYYLAGQEGIYTRMTMQDDGTNGDGIANDGNYAATIPAQPSGTYIRYYIETISNSSEQTRAYLPAGAEHETFVYRVNPIEATVGTLVINELMASNSQTIADESGSFPDWAEIYNNGILPVSVKGYYLSDDFSEPFKWQFPDITIDPGGYVLVWVDDDEEDEGELHASFKLSKEGEELLLSDAEGNPLDFVEFGAQQTDVSYGRSPNGMGDFKSLSAPTPKQANPTE